MNDIWRNFDTTKLVESVVVIVVVIISWLILRGYLRHELPKTPLFKCPDELNTPGVLVGSDFLSKKLFVEKRRLGAITDIAFGELDKSQFVKDKGLRHYLNGRNES